MTANKGKIEIVDKTFQRELDNISLANTMVSGYKPSIRRLTKAIRKHSLWEKIKSDIASTPLEDDRRRNE